MQQNKQEASSNQDNEINLIELFDLLMTRKFFIVGLTIFITVLAFLHTKTIVPSYQATSSFISPSKNSLFNINQLLFIDETKDSFFSEFLYQLSSRDLQKQVFVENDFLTIFNKDNDPIDNVDNFINGIINSVEVIPPQSAYDKLIEYPYLLRMVGSDKEAISKFLNALIANADSKNIMDLKKLNQEKISIRLNQITIESEQLVNKAKQTRLNEIERIMEEDSQKIREINDQIDRERYKAKEDRLNQIIVLSDYARLAKSLGIIENNLKMLNEDLIVSDLTIAINKGKDLPEWYLYGEKALIQRTELLKIRKSDDPFIPELVILKNQLNLLQNNNLLKTLRTRQNDSPFISELVTLDIEKNKLKLNALNLVNSTSFNIVDPTKIAIIAANKRLIVLLAFIGSFIISILLVLFMAALKRNKKAPT